MTIREIAEIANVSIGTVDRVLHNRGNVSAEKREKLQAIIEQYGFKPNAFASGLKSSKNSTVGVLLPLNSTTEHAYWELVLFGVKKAIEELHNRFITVKVFEFSQDVEGAFSEAANQMLTEGYSSAIIAPVCPDETRKFLAAHPDLPFLLIDTPLPSVNAICTLSQNPFRSGILAGKLMSMICTKSDRFVTIRNYNSYNCLERIRGFKSYFSNTQSSVVHDELTTDHASLISVLESLYADYGKVDGIFVASNALAHLVGDEITYLGKKDSTIVIGFDLTSENRTSLCNGTIDCLLSQRGVYQGYNSLIQIYSYLVLRQQLPRFIDIPADIIFRENVPEEYAADQPGDTNPWCISVR